MRYSITLSYDGSAFCGWQIQPNAATVQECLEKALTTLLKAETDVTGAGRTDSKVNAVGYVAHFDCENPLDTAHFRYKLNAILPRGIVIHEVTAESDDFHARFGATRREYTYFLHRCKDPFVESHSYYYPYPLDVEAMNRAAQALLGTHDFSCFEKVGGDNKTSRCNVMEARWVTYSPAEAEVMGFPCQEGDHIYFRIAADRFLRNMVRAVVGSLIEVGRGRRSVEDFASLVLPFEEQPQKKEGALPNRCLAGESVPGHALFLSKIIY